jgi:hypothetical protein
MKTKKSLFALAAVIVACIVFIWLSTSLHGIEKTYEIQPQISLPEYRTDAARAIDAYERLMERYMDLTERNLAAIRTDIKISVKKLDSIDNRLKQLSAKIGRIERKLGIEQPNPATANEPNPKPACKETKSKCPASAEQ